MGKTDEEDAEDNMKRAAANDPASICMLATRYHYGRTGLQQDHAKAMELYARAGQLGCSKAHGYLCMLYRDGGYLKKAKFHYEAAAMAGREDAWYSLGNMEYNLGKVMPCMHLRTVISVENQLTQL
jgi:TPR repeat protein